MSHVCVSCGHFKVLSELEMILQNVFAGCVVGVWKNHLDSDLEEFVEQLKTAETCVYYTSVGS